MGSLQQVDPEVYDAIKAEEDRENQQIVLIPSENYVSSAVMEAQGSVLTNKYAEGYAGKRYYGGCQHVDVIELLAIKRTKAVFGAEHVNVQPHSGSSANMAAYFSVLSPGDTIMGMKLSHGGHLTHGAKVSLTGKVFRSVAYGVDRETGLLDYDEIAKKARSERPKLIIVGTSAYSRIIDFEKFKQIAEDVGAYLLADIAHIAGLVAAGLHPSPVPHADFVTTTTHKTLRGPRGGLIMCREKFAKAVDKTIFPGMQGGPLMHVIAAKAVLMKQVQTEGFKIYQKRIISNAKALAEALIRRRFDIFSGGTDTHLMLIDLTNKSVTGKEAEDALEDVGVTVNKNSIPFDLLPPVVTSGIRIGTPIVSAREMGADEMDEIASIISDTIDNIKADQPLTPIRERVRNLCDRFPLERNQR